VTAIYLMASRPGPVETEILAELSPTFTVRRRPAGNLTLRYLEGGHGNPICLLHGRGHAATMWLPYLAELARHHHVIAVDLPGFGHSSSSPFDDGDAEKALRFFVEPIETLLGTLGLARAALIGHSLGALVAVELALRGAIAPDKLVLIDGMGLGPTMTTASRAFFRAGPERLARLLGARLFNRISPFPETPLGQRLAALEHELCTIPGGRPAPTAAFNALFSMRGPVFHRRERLREISAPTQLVWGEKDAAFPAPVAIAAAAAIPGARLRMEPLGHSPHLEAPERVLPLLRDFLSSSEGVSSPIAPRPAGH